MLCAVQHMLSAFLEKLRLRRKTHLGPNAQAIAARVVCFSLGLFQHRAFGMRCTLFGFFLPLACFSQSAFYQKLHFGAARGSGVCTCRAILHCLFSDAAGTICGHPDFT